ncbi:hypothetical protein NEF87_001016 [Candidatus Lokiarchaeum ossiferum]|uniref:Uncharacterized protein n=1 Tax=Candidatus Lokiarchaeum ossiferum TaxID=2951803 RepID=A0ABY6HQA5_9ARCH|nr:hypothetical protein NEF87_001016 [Candidatus Lokiarchaeum sp. B-35]
MKNQLKRVLIATGMGAILGIFCIIGQSQRMPLNPNPNATIYLLAAWYNRVIMGMLIGFAGEWFLLKNKPRLNSVVRGAILGTVVSISFGLLQQRIEIMYFFAGIVWGLLNDLITTTLMNRILKKSHLE